jgi:hypothetical protein
VTGTLPVTATSPPKVSVPIVHDLEAGSLIRGSISATFRSERRGGGNMMRLPTKRVGKLWTGFARLARKFPRSPWMSVVAALAVVLGTAGTYVSGQIQTDTQSCTVRRELLLANGSRELALLRPALLKSAEARTYLTLALHPQPVEQRREYAFLGVTAANNAIMSLSGGRFSHRVVQVPDRSAANLP